MSEIRNITLAGKEHPVKPLVIRQLRIVEPAIERVKKCLREHTGLTSEMYDDLVEICYQAICPSQETPLKRDDFMNWHVTTEELFEAFPIIAMQAGQKKREQTSGEAPAVKEPTSTQS